ncbi:hypothetical protein BDV26DRAFT_277849 [Aspergillus bertholletiae]|uniref:F-box domain-containing protein n=1 Tax=Aspergillus bertholletiae TaxID=1226010 RepID=A0A5N7BLQ0_9EURO|nr:hypothetical protein BDV26DRAFT_277849 [Aspergillus bertholletiae]
MYLNHLPNKIVFIIASYIPSQEDLYALLRTNRHLYHILLDYVYKYNSRYYHGSTLVFVTKHGNIGLRSESPAEERRNEDSDWGTDDEYRLLYSLIRDIFHHLLRIVGYSAADIVQSQKVLFTAIEINHRELVNLLLQRGAQVNFYRRNLYNDRVGPLQHPYPGYAHLVKYSLEQGAGPDCYRPSSLYRAVEDGRYDIVMI